MLEFEKGIDNCSEIHFYLDKLHKMNLPKVAEYRIAAFSKSFYVLESEKTLNRRVEYLQFAKNACSKLIKYERFKCENLLDLGLIYLKLGKKILAKKIFADLVEEFPAYEFIIDKILNIQSNVSAFDALYELTPNVEEEKIANEVHKSEQKFTFTVKDEDESRADKKGKEKCKVKGIANQKPKSWRENILKEQNNEFSNLEITEHFKKKIKNRLLMHEKQRKQVFTYNITPELTVCSADKNIIFPIIEDNIIRMNIMLNEVQLLKHLTIEQFYMVKELLHDENKCRIARDIGQDGIKNYANKVIGIKLHALGDLRCIGYSKLRIEAKEEGGGI